MTVFSLIISFFLVLFMLPIIVQQIAIGSPPSTGGPFRKFQLAQPWLSFAGNLFVLMVCLIALNRLVEHFGLIGADLAARIDGMLQYPFLLLFAAYVLLWAQAALKLRQSTQ